MLTKSSQLAYLETPVMATQEVYLASTTIENFTRVYLNLMVEENQSKLLAERTARGLIQKALTPECDCRSGVLVKYISRLLHLHTLTHKIHWASGLVD
jgi:hypothetical protein